MTSPGLELGRPGDGRRRHRPVSTGPVRALGDSWAEALRHLRAMPRNPDLLVFCIVQPIMFVVLFAYVFGDSIEVAGYPDYLQYLMPGLFAQSMVFNSNYTGVGVAEDRSTGFLDRLRTLPMFPPGVLVGRTISDLVRNVGTLVVMFAVGYLVGFRVEGSLAGAAVATLLLLAFGYAFSWIQALIGLSASSAEAAASAGFIWMFPLTFVSSAFVAPSSMPAAFEWFAEVNPVTALSDACRDLYNGASPGGALWIAVAWAAGITAVFATLAARRFRRSLPR
jgi:ABC-2 type transport system permease protein/oleandomycin transport system permease protein